MKILLDTNIVLDVLMDRMPFSDSAVELFSKVEDGTIIGYLCGTTITTVYYLATKTLGASRAQEEIKKLLNLLKWHLLTDMSSNQLLSLILTISKMR